MTRYFPCLAIFFLVLLSACTPDHEKQELTLEKIRIASFNLALELPSHDSLLTLLATEGHDQSQKLAGIIQRVRPDVLALMEFSYDSTGRALELFQDNYLGKAQEGSEAIGYPYVYLPKTNTGQLSGLDIDQDGSLTGWGDAWGFGRYPGQYAMAFLSRFPIDTAGIRTFRTFAWKDMPGALLPQNPESQQAYYASHVEEQFRLSSKNHVDIPLNLPNGKVLHLIAAHPTPPVFDGPEDRNGRRNHDEIRLLADYLKGEPYIYDDQGNQGGLDLAASFVVVGDLNADPEGGDGLPGGILQLLELERVHQQASIGEKVPTSLGARENAEIKGERVLGKTGNPARHTAGWGLRVDYVLPSRDFEILDNGVFWPTQHDSLAYLMQGSSDHRMVWVDIR